MSAAVSELVLGPEPDAVPRARQFVVDALSGAPKGQRDDAELVVAELVTNAILHGSPPVTLRVQMGDDGVRIDVEDSGRQRPMAVRGGVDAMTGRGLNLVSCLSTEWGVTAADGEGKVVWAKVPADGV